MGAREAFENKYLEPWHDCNAIARVFEDGYAAGRKAALEEAAGIAKEDMDFYAQDLSDRNYQLCHTVCEGVYGSIRALIEKEGDT